MRVNVVNHFNRRLESFRDLKWVELHIDQERYVRVEEVVDPDDLDSSSLTCINLFALD